MRFLLILLYLPYSLFFGLVFAALVWFTPLLKGYDGQYHASFYLIVVVVYIVHQVCYKLIYFVVSKPISAFKYIFYLPIFLYLFIN